MTQQEARAISEDRMEREAAAHLRGEEVAEDAALIGAAGYAADYVDEHESVDAALGGYSASPTGEDKRPAFERTRYRPRECSFHQILELWAAHEGGRLLRVLHVAGKDDQACGEDDARRAWEWVSETPGWNRSVHAVMKHLVFKNLGWDEWPREAAVRSQRVVLSEDEGKTERVEYWAFCDLPFLSYEAAGAAWEPFYRRLRRRYREEPFTIDAPTVEFA